MSLKSKIVYNTAIQFGGRFLTSFVGFLTTLILARYLGAQNYGVYTKIYTLAAFFYLFIDFGLNAVYVRKHKDNLAKLGEIFVLRTVFFVISLMIIGLFLFLTQNLIFTPTQAIWALLFTPTILLFGYYTTLNIVFQLRLRYDLSVLAAVVGGVVGLALLLATIRLGLIYAIFSVVFGYLITVMLSFFFVSRISGLKYGALFQYSRGALLKMVHESLPLGVMLFLNTMYSRADVFVLSAIKGDSAVGVYQLAYKFFEFPLSFAAFFANSIFPHYIKIYEVNPARFWQVFKKATLYLVLVSFLFTLGAFLLAPLLGLIKSDYAASAKPLQILSLSYPIFFLTSALSWLVFVIKKEKHLVWIYGLSFLINVVGNILWVPHVGYFASSWLTVLGEVLVLVCLIKIVKI